VTEKSANTAPRNVNTHIIALGKKFHSDVEALTYFSKHFKETDKNNRPVLDGTNESLQKYLASKGVLEFHIKGVTEKSDWSDEPKETMHQLCNRLCEMLEQTYDEIIVSHSGGTDSETITQLFLQRGTRNITLMRRSQDLWPGDNAGRTETHIEPMAKWLDKHTSKATEKKYGWAFKNLGWKMKFVEQLQPYNEKQYERSLQNKEFLSWENDYSNISSWAQNSGDVFAAKPKRVCFIEGLEKPIITLHNGWYCFRMHHDSQWWGQPLAPPGVDRVWFWMNELVPELIQKLAHLKCQEIKKIFNERNTLPTQAEVELMNRASHPCRLRLNRAMGMNGLTEFHDRGEASHMESLNAFFGPLEFQPTPGEDYDWKHWDITARSKKEHRQAMNKMKIRDTFYDQIITPNIHHHFLNKEDKTLYGISTKTIPIMPVTEDMIDGKSEENNTVMSSGIGRMAGMGM